jgi:L-ascorbate metabolism protein UlaG (beta-lactamase superfamily)
MDVQFYGANCITISNKKVRIVIDDNLEDLGQKSVTKAGDVALYTGAHSVPKVETQLVIDHPGEYEVSEVSIYGVAVRAHMDEPNKRDATAYKIILDDVRFLVTGHIYPELSERQLEAIGTVDVMFVPVGGSGYTTDAIGALKLIKKIEPKIIIPTHYDDKGLKFPVPQQSLDQALTELAMEPKERVEKLKLKSSDLGEGLQQLIVLEKS